MPSEKRVLLVTFSPPRLKSTQEMRDWFASSYDRFLNMDEVEYKCWWVDQDKGQWGALYVFRSEEAVREYLASDIWSKVIPEKYGCVPQARVVEAGLILSKEIIEKGQDSWLNKE